MKWERDGETEDGVPLVAEVCARGRDEDEIVIFLVTFFCFLC